MEVKKISKIISLIMIMFITFISYANDSIKVTIDEITVTSFYKSKVNNNDKIDDDKLLSVNYGQEPSHVFSKMPSIISLNDNGTEFGYGYYRIRGLDQTRINVTLDGCPWNEAEDFGSYFANSPDLMSSMQSITVERGTNSSYNGVAGSAGGILLESINLYKNNESYVNLMGGSFNTYKTTFVYNMIPKNGWGFHAKVTNQSTDGYRDYGFNDSKALTLKVGYKFNDKHQIDLLTMSGYHRNGQGWIGCTLDELSINNNANGCSEKDTDEFFTTMNRLQYKGFITDKIVLTSSIYAQYQNGSYRMDFDNFMKRMIDKNSPITNKLYSYGLSYYMVGNNTFAKFYFNKFKVTTGINYYIYNRKHFLDNQSKNMDEFDYYDNNGIKHDLSAIGILSYTNHGFDITGNLQYRYVNFNYRDNITNEFYHLSQWNFLNFGLSATYNFLSNHKVYGSFNRVYREPTRSDMFGGNEWYNGELATITPEICNDFEIGYSFNNNKVNLNLNLYYMWFKNELVLNGEYGSNGLPCHENAKNSFRTGVEGEINWNVISNLFFNINGSYSYNKINTDKYGYKNHIMSPSITTNADLYWKNNKWGVGVNFNFHDDMYIDMNNEYMIPYVYTLNVYGNVKMSDFDICVYLNNITNKTNYNTGMIGSDGDILYIQNAKFNFNISVKYFFK